MTRNNALMDAVFRNLTRFFAFLVFSLLAAILVFAGSVYLFCTKLTTLLDTGTTRSSTQVSLTERHSEGESRSFSKGITFTTQ